MQNTLTRPGTTGRTAILDLGTARRRPRLLLAGVAILVILALVAGYVTMRSRASTVSYTTTPVISGNLAQTVTASGTVNPQNTISVGTQVSGTLSEVDVDYNSKVKKGEVLARIDPTTLQAQLDSAQAQLAQSEAQAAAAGASAQGGTSAISQAQAQAQAAQATAQAANDSTAAAQANVVTMQTAVTKAQSALALAQTTVTRDKSLLAQGYIAQSAVDTDSSNEVAAQSALDAAKAAVLQAQAQVAAARGAAISQNAQAVASQANTGVSSASAEQQAATHDADVAAISIQRANVAQAQKAVQNSVITSPVDGTVIARDVSVGQTVASSLSTPTLFSIAQDLSKMEVDLSVGESDIGRVTAGDPVTFTVLAFPNRTFTGTVTQVRQSAVTTSNVVTYTTVVIVNNKDGALLPGMTANATIQVAHVSNATIVPLTALNYTPPAGAMGKRGGHRTHTGAATTADAAAPKTAAAKTAGAGTASPWGGAGATTGAITPGSTGRVFVLKAGKLTPVPVTVGLVSDTTASVTPLRGTLTANDAVVTGDSSTHAAKRTSTASSAANPLGGGPQGGGRGQGGPR
jgi:HlyD family secretion protein